MKTCFAVAAILAVLACSDPVSRDKEVEVSVSGVFITNEGNYGGNNGSLSFYNTEDKTIQNNIFETLNGRALGDVVQGMTIDDTLGYIVINGSATIEIISLNTWLSQGTIALPGTSPRTLRIVSDKKAYITDLYSSSVAVVNLESKNIAGSIAVGTNPDAMLLAEGKAYVANHGWGWDNTISVINTQTDQVQKTIRVADNPAAMDIDEFGKIHVFCSGNYGDYNDPDDDTNGGVYVIDPISDVVVDSVVIAGHPAGGSTNHNGKGFYSLNGTLYSYPVEMVSSPVTEVLSGFFYGFSTDKITGKIYTLDAKDYVQAGDLKIYDSSGSQQETHTAGIIPGKVIFVYDNN